MTSSPSIVTPEIVTALAPTGTLRVALNLGNTVLVQRNPSGGEPGGVTVALGKELSRTLGIPLQFVQFDEAGLVFEAQKENIWDICFLAIDPIRATGIDFTAPYVLIEGTYMVTETSPLEMVDQVDVVGQRIAVSVGSAYDLYLTRNLKHAGLLRVENFAASIAALRNGDADTVAGVRQPLESYADQHSDVRVMAGGFMGIAQAMGTHRGREIGLSYLKAFIEEHKASGFVRGALLASGQKASLVAPAARNEP